MSWSVLVEFEKNKCMLCSNPLTPDSTPAIILLGSDLMVGMEALTHSEEEEYDPPCEVLIGMDWKEEYLFHTNCLLRKVAL